MNEEKLNENRELIEKMAGFTNKSIEILRTQTQLLENAVNKTINIVNDAKELSDKSYAELDTLSHELIDILNVLEKNSNAPYDAYFAVLEEIDNEPWEKM